MCEVPADRVREHTAAGVNAELHEHAVQSVAALVGAPAEDITRRIAELDREWDVERVLERTRRRSPSSARSWHTGPDAGWCWRRSSPRSCSSTLCRGGARRSR